ncbi:transmembrane protein 65 isoform X4 [Drosophila ananassae]|uniref:transmembrane protein 65 isoform X4 n=1 Tax=Drosophila ananassae TaxID=7217 RepID=UPI0013A5C44D|nr:transmembrane protein 65 isoform X4 [Drosophila ananassae]
MCRERPLAQYIDNKTSGNALICSVDSRVVFSTVSRFFATCGDAILCQSSQVTKTKRVEAAPPPTAGQLYSIFFVNAVPFIAFGFLDNFIMIIAGEYIELSVGQVVTLSTMATAGLGNTISDIMGITLATYVENGCQILGLKQPMLTSAQFELKSSKRATSIGRIMGITVGCLLGMCPLWFMNEKAEILDDN